MIYYYRYDSTSGLEEWALEDGPSATPRWWALLLHEPGPNRCRYLGHCSSRRLALSEELTDSDEIITLLERVLCESGRP